MKFLQGLTTGPYLFSFLLSKDISSLKKIIHFMKKTSYEWGFSLVELAIGLLVIGLLIGGVFKGRNLLQNARIQDTIAQISDYQLAVASFVDRYQALPGDFQGASGIFGLEGYDGNQDSGYGLQAGSEAVGFWQHLAAAKLIQSPGAPRSGQNVQNDRYNLKSQEPACVLYISIQN